MTVVTYALRKKLKDEKRNKLLALTPPELRNLAKRLEMGMYEKEDLTLNDMPLILNTLKEKTREKA